MNEKIYRTMNNVGNGNVALGIIVLIAGIAGIVGGVLSIINGIKLKKRKSDILF